MSKPHFMVVLLRQRTGDRRQRLVGGQAGSRTEGWAVFVVGVELVRGVRIRMREAYCHLPLASYRLCQATSFKFYLLFTISRCKIQASGCVCVSVCYANTDLISLGYTWNLECCCCCYWVEHSFERNWRSKTWIGFSHSSEGWLWLLNENGKQVSFTLPTSFLPFTTNLQPTYRAGFLPVLILCVTWLTRLAPRKSPIIKPAAASCSSRVSEASALVSSTHPSLSHLILQS